MYEDQKYTTGAVADEDIPALARRCWDRYMQATEEAREAEKESAGFWIGGKFQWRKGEVETRRGKQRPWMSIPRLKAVVDQVENEARQNTPGPQAHPVGGGADKDGADIVEGLIREYEARCNAQAAYITALRTACARMRGCFELATEFTDEKSFEQQIIVKEIANPDLMFYDPDAVAPCREDTQWQGKIRCLSKEQLIQEYGPDLKVLNRTLISSALNWMADAFGARDASTLTTWTGGGQQNNYYVCEFWRVETDPATLTLYDDHLTYFEDDDKPKGAKPVFDKDGKKTTRIVGRRKIMKYLVTALDLIKKTRWYGSVIPIFWVMGPEMWMDGKCYRHSLISPGLDAQRGLNYTATTAIELVGNSNKTPFIGFVGQFAVRNAQGINPWENYNTTVYPYMEVNPVYAKNPSNGQQELLPPPSRNTWEAPIQRVMELANFFTEQIKAATSVFFEPSLQGAARAQSGRAIQALQQQTNIGTLNWQDNLHRAVGISYQEAYLVMKELYDSQRVRTIVRPDWSHEIQEINREFPANVVEHQGKKRNNITNGMYALRVTAGPNFRTRQEKSIESLTEVFKIIPQLLGMPMIAAQFLRMLGEGNPQIEQMADALMPQATSDNPQQMQAQLAQAQNENQQLKQALGQLQQQIAAKLPEQETKKWVATLQALAGIREAEIKAGVDKAQMDLSFIESKLGMAHESGMQAVDHEHEASQQEAQQQAAAQAQQSDQLHAATSQASDQAAAQQQADQANQGDDSQ